MQNSKLRVTRDRRIMTSVAVVTAVVMAAVVRLAGSGGTAPSKSDRGKPAAEPSPAVTARSKATEILNRHLAWADRQGGNLTERVAPIRELFEGARLGTRKFSEEALGFSSKFFLVKDFITDGSEHKAFLQEQFAKNVFAPEELEAAVRSVVATHVRRLESLDSELLVRLQADLAEVPNLQMSANVDRQAIEASLDRVVRQAISAVEAELRGDVAFELVSYVAGEVLTAATFKLATSAGILGAGVTSGAVSFGIGLVVSLIADALLSVAYDAYFDPAGELSRQLNQTLDSLETLILTGDDSGPGLIQRLQDYGAKRSKARNAAIRSAVLPGSAAASPAMAL